MSVSSSTQDGNMVGEAKGFATLFDQFKFIIPPFQREFEWEKDQIITFIDDIFGELDSGRQYFFGPIVLLNPERGLDQQLVDGQQRLTSFSILTALLADLIYEESETATDPEKKGVMKVASEGIRQKVASQNSGNWNTKITPHQESKIFYKDLLSPERPSVKINNLEPQAKGIAKKAMYVAYKEFEKKIKEKFFDSSRGKYPIDQLMNFNNKICDVENYVLLQIKLPNAKTAWQVFINLNKKGQELQTATMIKAVLLSRIPEIDGTSHPRQDYTLIWNNIISNLTDPKLFDQFLHHYVVATDRKISEKELYAHVYDKYTTQNKAQDLIEELAKYAEYYRICVKPENSDFRGQDAEVIVENLGAFKKNLGIVHAFPILLAGYTEYELQGDTSRFKRLVDMVLRFFIRTRTICQEEPGKLEQISSELSDMIRKRKYEEDIKAKMIANQPHKALFNAKFKDKDKSTIKLDFYILYKISLWGYNESSSELSQIAPSKRSIEHIMVKTLNQEWKNHLRRNQDYSDEELKQLHTANLNKWGNLAPMNKDNNSTIKDLSFHEKNIHTKGYKASNSKIIVNIPKDTRIDTDPSSITHGQEIPVHHAQHDSKKTPEDTWDFESINERTETLCQKAEKIFKVT